MTMTYNQGKDKFLQAWGTLGSDWGISRTMAQIHALLMISPKALSADEVMEELQISRGNVNMNLRALMDWGLVFKELKSGDRKEYFVAEKDMWKVSKQIIINRKKKELEPIVKVLDEVSMVQSDCANSEEFVKIVRDIKLFSNKADSTLDSLIQADSNWFMGTFFRLMR
jgi:DNA-binding transcriptional regulator GbsR (MarR family)